MGHVSAPFGVRGWIKVHAYTETGDGLLDYPVWWVGKPGAWRECAVLDAEVHSKSLAAHLEGCNDRDAAAALRGALIAVPREALPPAEADEYYWNDLIGLRVVNAQGQDLGEVAKLLETGANDVLVVQGERERLIPFVAGTILEVDVDSGRIRVDWGADY
ncbi:MAG: ribosome maturation factor RimM [Pseudomonadota bacterium]